MVGTDLRYYRGGENCSEIVELPVLNPRDGSYITTCVVNVKLLLGEVWTHPCGNGDDLWLSPYCRLKVLEFLQAERKKITDKYPIKTLGGWRESGLGSFEEYCFPGDEVDEAMVEYFANVVPPTLQRSGCTQCGEAHSFERGEIEGLYETTFITFHRIANDRWIFDGYCFEGENKNRDTRPSRVQQLIDEARKEVC